MHGATVEEVQENRSRRYDLERLQLVQKQSECIRRVTDLQPTGLAFGRLKIMPFV